MKKNYLVVGITTEIKVLSNHGHVLQSAHLSGEERYPDLEITWTYYTLVYSVSYLLEDRRGNLMTKQISEGTPIAIYPLGSIAKF